MMRTIKLVSFLLLGLIALAMPVASHAQVAVGISIRVGPPALPVYVQPVCPEPGYHWIPGYWAYGPDGYYWVPGTWVEPPVVGVLWTPGYWGWRNGFYIWNGGYWGPHVGFYGGINYGFGYTGVGFAGGYWRNNAYYYNRSVTNINVTNIHNTYNTTVINNNTTVNRVSFNGGAGGTTARATAAEQHAEHEHHFEATTAQTQHQHFASTNHDQLASINHGHPNVAASPKPGVFHGQGVVTANKDANFQKFSRTNTSPSGGSGPNSANTFAKKGSGLQNNAPQGNGSQSNGPQGGKIRSTDSLASHGNNSHNAVNGNSTSNPNKTYHTDARVRQNNARPNNAGQNNSHVNNAHVNSNAHVHAQNGGQHSDAHEPHRDKR